MIKSILKGMIIGLANIIPGVSGGTLAISMGIYDKLINCIIYFFEDTGEKIRFLLPIALGMGIALVGSVFGIDFLFESYPLQANLLFVGLILGSVPLIYGKVSKNVIKLSYILGGIILFTLVIIMAFVNGVKGEDVVMRMDSLQVILLFLVGILGAATMVVPGVSGSMILLLLGYYNPILDTIKEGVIGIVKMDFGRVINAGIVLAPFGLGLILGVIVIARIIEYLFRKYPLHTYWGILGLLLASPIGILKVGDLPKLGVLNSVTGIIAFVIGGIISQKLGERE